MDAISGCTVWSHPPHGESGQTACSRPSVLLHLHTTTILVKPWHCLSYLPYATDAVPELPCILLLHIDETEKRKFP